MSPGSHSIRRVGRALLLALALHAAPSRAEETGTLVGQVFDADTGTGVAGVAVTLIAPAGSGAPAQQARQSGPDGGFDFGTVPAGRYELSFAKPGYRDSRLTDFAVVPGQANRADFPLPPLANQGAADAPSTDIEEFIVTGSTVAMESLELRVDSDELLNVLSAEELSKFAASDVGDALKRVAGVNVVEGQFAIIRGLEDRYSSTLYNAAPVPSPDPDRQSVQLDLFPAEIVNDLVVAKTFAPHLPGNSAGGSLDIVTLDYPDEFEVAVNLAGGFNENAVFDRFLEFENGSPVGTEWGGAGPFESEIGAFVGGRSILAEREVRYKALVNWQRDYETAVGHQQGREPTLYWSGAPPKPAFVLVPQSGGLSLGKLELSRGRFDLTDSTEATQITGYAGFGVDLDEGGNHRLDASLFYTRKDEDTVELYENGFLPNFDYSQLATQEASSGGEIVRDTFLGFATLDSWISRRVRVDRSQPVTNGPLWFTNMSESKSFRRDRDLFVSQLNGDHWVAGLPGLRFAWAGNYAATTQDETSRATRYFFEPTDLDQPAPTSFPAPVRALGSGFYASRADPVIGHADVDEKQGFGRLDAVYATNLSEPIAVELRSGGWYEHARRDVASSFLESPTVSAARCGPSPNCVGSQQQFSITGDTPQELGRAIRGNLIATADRPGENESTREVWAWNLGSKATLWEHVDLLAGFRLENLQIESLNDPFGGQVRFGAPDSYPTRYLLWDRVDNPSPGVNEVGINNIPPAATIFNDQVLGLSVPVDFGTTACDPPGGPPRGCVDVRDQATFDRLVNGLIDEQHWLPATSFAWRPLQGLSLRGAYSQTVARPSFREMGFYVTIEPGSDDLVVGNPQLQTSFVTSYDTRVEYVWGELGELASISAFYKTIDDPIESIIVRNPLNASETSGLYRTFFNNPSQATLWGIEAEGRKNLGFLGPDIAEYFSVGGNFTWIDATVDRTEAEVQRSTGFFGVVGGDAESFTRLEGSRRLFGQPKWIANADLAFDEPDWGTRVTLSFFAISDVLDAAGSTTIGPDGRIRAFTPDRYVDSFYQLDLVVSQTWEVPLLRGDVVLKLSAKNLTDSTRQIVYDKAQTVGEISERSYKVGRDYKLSLTYRF